MKMATNCFKNCQSFCACVSGYTFKTSFFNTPEIIFLFSNLFIHVFVIPLKIAIASFIKCKICYACVSGYTFKTSLYNKTKI